MGDPVSSLIVPLHREPDNFTHTFQTKTKEKGDIFFYQMFPVCPPPDLTFAAVSL